MVAPPTTKAPHISLSIIEYVLFWLCGILVGSFPSAEISCLSVLFSAGLSCCIRDLSDDSLFVCPMAVSFLLNNL